MKSSEITQRKSKRVLLCVLSLVLAVPPLSHPANQPPGLIIESVTPDSMAAKVGLKVGDRLLTYDGKPLTSPATLQALQQNTFGKKEVRLRLRRGNDTEPISQPANQPLGVVVELTVPVGALCIAVRPDLPPAVLKLYEEGRDALAAGNPDEAIARWTNAAKRDSRPTRQPANERTSLAWLHGRIGDKYELRGKWKEAHTSYAAAWELIEASEDAAGQSMTLSHLGSCSRHIKDLAVAQKWYEHASKIDAAAGYEMWLAINIVTAANIAYSRDDLNTAHDYHSRALTILDRLVPDSLVVATCLTGLGNVAFAGGEPVAAQSYYTRSLVIRERLAPDSLPVADSLTGLGMVARVQDHLSLANDYHIRALAIRERLKPNSLDVAASLGNLGVVAHATGDLTAAHRYYSRALLIFEQLSPDSLSVARILGNLGSVAHDRSDLKTAQDYHQFSLAIRARLLPDSLDVAASLNSLGLVTKDQGDLTKAHDYFSRALSIHERIAPDSPDVAAMLDNLGAISRDRGELSLAKTHFSRSLAIRERTLPGSQEIASSLTNLGALANDQGDLHLAQNFFQRGLAIQEKSATVSDALGVTLNNLGAVARSLGDFSGADRYYNRALKVFEQRAHGSLDVARCLNNLGGLAHSRGTLSTAYDYHLDALAIQIRLAPNSLDTATTLNHLGIVSRDRGDLSAANHYHSRAFAIRELVMPKSLQTANTLNNLGIVAYDRGDLVAAHNYYSRAFVIREEHAPGSLDVAASLNNLGLVAHARGDLSAARQYHANALAIREMLAPHSLDASASQYNLGVVAHDSGDRQAAKSYYMRALSIRRHLAPGSLEEAGCLNNLGYLALQEHAFSDARDRFANAAQIVESHRLGIRSPQSRMLLVEKHMGEYTGWIRANLALEESANAFAALERSHSRSLVELLSDRMFDLRADAAPELLEKQVEVDRERSMSYAALARLDPNKDDDRRAMLRGTIEECSVKQRELDERFRKKSPKYAALQYPQPLDLKGAQAVLDPGTLLLTYFVDADETYLFAVTRTGLQLHRLKVKSRDLSELVLEFRLAISRPGGAVKRRGNALYDLLVRPAQTEIDKAQRVLVCPDGSLHQLPFGALGVSQGAGFRVQGAGTARSSPLTTHHSPVTSPVYFADLKPLHTIASMTVYAENRKRTDGKTGGRGNGAKLLAFGDPEYGSVEVVSDRNAETRTSVRPTMRDRKLTRLPGTRAEVEAIAKLYGKQATIRLGKDATAINARSESATAVLLHFACHGVIDQFTPLASGLALSPEGDDNGMLQAWQIIEKVRLNADLVVLSACQTGLGETTKHEGVIGLTRALQYAGAKSIVVSLWSVSDDSTAALMTTFYTELKKGTPKDVALQRAMAAVRKNPKWSHPFYWAPFTLHGEWR